jgi:hypothetical protein
MVNADTNIFGLGRGKGTSGLAITFRERPAVNFGIIGNKTKPTPVQLGAYSTWSMPIWDNGGNEFEEIFFNHSVPRRWDGVTNPTFGFIAMIDDAAAAARKFQFQLSWKNVAAGIVTPVTTNDTTYEVTTGTDAQYMCYPISFTIDYDVDVANVLTANQVLGLRLRRVAKSAGGTEFATEILVHGFYIQYNRNKIGVSQ